MRCGGVSLALVLFCAMAMAADQRKPVISGVPGPLEWQNVAVNWQIDEEKKLTITGGKQTDWFVSPMDGAKHDNSPRLLFRPAEDFVLSAKVTVHFESQWDGGALVVYAGEGLWAKLCLEKTVEQHPAIVTVVTRTLSDDSNSIAVQGNSVYLKIAKAGQAIFFYASEDGMKWSIIRAFSLGATQNLRVGFSSQAPLGEKCTTVFEEIRYSPKRVDLWSGQ